MGQWVAPPSEEGASRKATRLVRGGCASLLIASVMAMLSGVVFIQYDPPLRFFRDMDFELVPVWYYYDSLGSWTLFYLLVIVGVIGLFVAVHALSHEVSLYTLAYASFMVPVGFIAIVNLGLVMALTSLIALALFCEAWRSPQGNDPQVTRPPPYGVPAAGGGAAPTPHESSLMDMGGRSPSVLLRPAATLLLVASLALLLMFSQQYPTHMLTVWQQWLVYIVIAWGLVGVVLTAYRRLLPVVLLAAVALLAAALLDIYILLQDRHYFIEFPQLTFWLSGSSAMLAIVYIFAARGAFVPSLVTLTSRSSPSPSWPRPR